jgi:spore coat polysaccharide biosynthesis predicted glycosyltransferase SpsG/ribosomal protein S18 acetylase RimI-like enzyme
MKVLLFAEGSRSLGAGHQVRCGALARALIERGHEPLLAGRGLFGSAHAWAWAGLPQRLLPAATSLREAACEALHGCRPDVVVVDHYDLDQDALAELRRTAPLALVDDVPDGRAAEARLIVNVAPGTQPSDYADTPAALGPAHALLRPEFQASAETLRGPRAFVALGSADALVREAVLGALLEATPLELDLVGAAPHADPRVRSHQGLDAAAMAALMRSSRVGLVSASSICFEAACARLPFVAVETARNQQRLANGLRALGVAVLSVKQAQEPRRIAEALHCAEPGPLEVDGRGAERVAERLHELTIETRPARLRAAVWNDAARLLDWANEPGARRASFEEHAIQPEEHRAWLARKLMDPEARVFLVEDDGPAGTARLDREGRVATVSLAVAAERRGRGVGRRILDALREFSRRGAFAERLLALVREDNASSQQLFERAGYARTARLAVKGRPAYRYELPV